MTSNTVNSLKLFASPRFRRILKTNSSPLSSGRHVPKNLCRSLYDDSIKQQLPGRHNALRNEMFHFSSHASNDMLVDTPERADVTKNGLNSKKINSILGKGSFGTVVPGKYKGQTIAVKLVSREKHLTSLINEGNAAKLSHPNIVKILKVVYGEGSFGLVIMEMNLGFNLHELLQDSLFSWNLEKKLKYALNVAHGLEYCHRHDILHLDVKPKNVLFCMDSDTCKLCDFGSSLKLSELNEVLNMKNVGMNTVCYTAPELFKGGKPSKKADVYSFSITLWQLLSQCMPYKGIDSHSVIYRVVANEYRPNYGKFNSDIEENCLQLCKNCWKTCPSDRLEMIEIIEELKRIQILLK